MKYCFFFDTLSIKDVAKVGGKNASLGEMISFLKKKKIKIPEGFATSAEAYWKFLEENNIKEKIFQLLKKIKKDKSNLSNIGKQIREIIEKKPLPKDIEKEILDAYKLLSKKYSQKEADVAVRSSATAEDLPTASFAGQQESFLNVRGKNKLIQACIKCIASLFTDRAIAYRIEKRFDHRKIALSVGIQKMVRSDKASSGVIFTLDPESGFRDVISISAGFGLGENIVQGKIEPDEYQVYKPFLNQKTLFPIVEKKLGHKNLKLIYSKGKSSTINVKTTKKELESFVLTDREILQLANAAQIIEKHYKKPMDIEWAKDGYSKELFITQARPETVRALEEKSNFHRFKLLEKKKPFLKGIAIGSQIATGKVQIIKSVKDIKDFKKGSILVTYNTTPDWVPIMKKASGIITDHGGRTSHAAIVSRELNIPAIVGSREATKKLINGSEITLSCAEGEDGNIYRGLLKYKLIKQDTSKLKKPPIPIMINVASPSSVYNWWRLPIDGIGLARMEFIINNMIKIHPMALIDPKKIKDPKTKNQIQSLTKNYPDKKNYFTDILARSIAKIASSQYPKDVIVRLSDFKTNEYRSLIGGESFEDSEENPMIGFRGASRYYDKKYQKAFELECKALKRARDLYGFTNIIIMIPFCRTLKEADKVLKILEKCGLKRSKNLKIYVMAEIPSNVFLAEKFAEKFDGFSIGSNDLTQLILGIDRDSSSLANLFDAQNEAVKIAIKELIKKAHLKNCKVGICGQAPSDHPEFASFLIKEGIDSISLNPDSVISTIKKLNKLKKPHNA